MTLFWGADHEVPQSQVSLNLVLFNITVSDLIVWPLQHQLTWHDVLVGRRRAWVPCSTWSFSLWCVPLLSPCRKKVLIEHVCPFPCGYIWVSPSCSVTGRKTTVGAAEKYFCFRLMYKNKHLSNIVDLLIIKQLVISAAVISVSLELARANTCLAQCPRKRVWIAWKRE